MDWLERMTGLDMLDHGNGSIEVGILVLAAVLLALVVRRYVRR